MPQQRFSVACLLLLLIPSLSVLVAKAQQAAIEDDALVPLNDDNVIYPRFYMDAVPARPLGRRQDVAACPARNRHCYELGPEFEDQCCPDDRYCALNSNWELKCCQFESNCGSPCSAGSLYINSTLTIISTVSVPIGTETASDRTPTLMETTTTTLVPACSPMKCNGSQIQCPSNMGGACCPAGQACASSSRCVSTVTNPAPTLVPTDNGCSSSNMFSCPVSLGDGCCTSGQTCYSTGCIGQPTIPGGTISENRGLSQGAKAGIAIGVVVAAAAVIGGLTMFCIRRRREARRASTAYRSTAQTPAPNNNTMGEMSEVSGPSRPPVHQSGLAYDYFGPDAVAGPYTDQDGTPQRTPSVLEHGVPVRPRQPSDIAPPVELDSRWKADKTSAGISRTPSIMITPVREVEEGPFELIGSIGSPSPLSPDEAGHSIQSPGSVSPGGVETRK